MSSATAHIPRFSPSPQPAIASAAAAVLSPTLLLVGGDDLTASFGPSLRQQFRLVTAGTAGDGVAMVERERPDLVVTELSLQDGTGAAVCAAAQRFDPPPTLLVMAHEPEVVPDALIAGCDGVLLAPFAPNLLYTRLGRLMRERAKELRLRGNVRARTASSPLRSRGTNHYWPDENCPHCQAAGITSFEFHSHRRAWFACAHCRKVWIGRRLEDF